MGIDIHGLHFLKFASTRQPFGRVATIGRQGIHIPKPTLLKLIGAEDEEQSWPYCESTLMKHFGASLVHSFDNSGYEGATFIHDFNKPITYYETYDTVIDFGSLEHIYNVSQAFANVSALCAVGGQILHALPANNQCGHGFWQFSPELFYSLYSEANGYKETRVFIANTVDETHWYEVKPPANGGRAEVMSPTPLVDLVRTRKVGPLRQDVQQSDYAHMWKDGAVEDWLKDTVRQWPFLFHIAFHARQICRQLLPSIAYRGSRLSRSNRSLVRHPVKSLVAL